MENIKLCTECNCELLPYEKYVCDSCRRMIEEYEREQQDEDDYKEPYRYGTGWCNICK